MVKPAVGLQIQARIRRGDFVLEAEVTVEPGQTLALLGPNGAGKTTLLRAIAGLTPLDQGSICCAGQVWDDPAAGVFVDPTRRRAPVVFQDYRLFPHRTVLDNVAFAPRAAGLGRARARAVAADRLGRMGLAEVAHRRPRELSGGQAQRVAVARALAADPQVLLLDEPLAALDARTRQQVRVELKRTLDAFAGPAVLITHDPLEAMTLADRVVVLEAGRVAQSATPRVVAARPATDYIARLVGINLYAGTAGPGATIALDGGGVLTATTPTADGLAPGQRALAAVPPGAIAVHRQRPEQVSTRNVWSARILGAEQLRDRIRLDLHGMPPALADITPAAFAQLGLDIGDLVWLSVKATEVSAYPEAASAD